LFANVFDSLLVADEVLVLFEQPANIAVQSVAAQTTAKERLNELFITFPPSAFYFNNIIRLLFYFEN
jgi:hypothetical protein